MQYLAFGSNLLPKRLAARLGDISVIGTCVLQGWSLRFHKRGGDGSGKCNLVRADAATAYGVLYEINDAAKQQLDLIEGVGRGYEDVCIDLPEFGAVQVYLAQATHIDDSLKPYDWYRAFVSLGARQHGFPARYVAALESIETVRDPDEQRRAENFALR